MTLQFAAALALAILGAGLSAPAALAGPEVAPAPQAVLLSITSPADGAFVGDNSAAITGTKAAGSSIQIPGITGCTIQANDAETWSCTATRLRNGPGLVIAPVQTLDGATTTLDPPIRIDVLGPPTMDGGSTVLTTGVISGMAYPGATIILGIGATETTCPAPARGDGYWSCTLHLASNSYQVQAVQTISTIGSPPDNVSRPTAPRTVIVDRDPPAKPIVSTPRSGQRVLNQPTTFAGAGESGGRIDAYVDRTIVCSAAVIDGRWSCTAGGISNGRHSVQAVLRDAAGNYGTPSSPVWVYFGPEGAGASSPPPTTEDPVAPSSPSPTRTAPPLLPPDWPPSASEPGGSAPTLHEALTNWGTPTGFGSHLPSPAATVANGNWLVALAIAAGFGLLVALPLRLLVGTMRGRIRFRRVRFTGRNRGETVAEAEDDPLPVSPWLAALVPLAAATALVVFSGGFGGEVRFLRLAFAVGIGLGILNLVGVAIGGRLAAAGQRISGRLKVLPTLLIGAAIAAVGSRLSGIEPPFLIGVFVAIVFAAELPARSRAIVGIVELVTISALACVSWLAQQAIGPVGGFWASIPSETLTTICIAGFGSVIVLLLPVGSLPGRAIFEWSPTAWAVSVLVLVTAAVAVLLGDPIRVADLVVVGACAAAFAVVAVASWGWSRYVDPRHPDAA